MAFLCGYVAVFILLCGWTSGEFQVGRGIADITGLAAEGNLYGYANPDQDARGVHLRQYSRAFVFEAGGRRSVLVVAEVTMVTQAVHTEVLELLSQMYGDLYTRDNVLMSPTHSHSAPGGYHTYVIYTVPSGGVEPQTFRAAVDGIVKSIVAAHEDLQAGSVSVTSGDLTTASINRSPYSYSRNPQEERDRYEHEVDVEMTLMKMENQEGDAMGLISLFPVHTTSMKNTNHLVSTDNKGYASQQMERDVNGGRFPPTAGDVLTAFAQTAEGDASPNINEARCEGTDNTCNMVSSACPEDPEDPTLCTGRGPTAAIKDNEDDFEDTKIIGELQYLKAKELFESAGEAMAPVVDSRFTWANMSQIEVDVDGRQVQICRPSMGYSFGAGATDGPGTAPFVQGMLEGVFAIEILIEALFPGIRTEDLVQCHAPKPIVLPTANIEFPYPYWQPEIVPVQVMRVGEIVLIGIPGEVTTMAGRRLENVVKEVYGANGEDDIRPIVMSMANCYSSYVVTPEEYMVQRYEGASTIFGPYTLNGYMEIVRSLTEAMVKGEAVDGGTPPPDLRDLPDIAQDPVMVDDVPDGLSHGALLMDVEQTYQQGDIASALFMAGNPRNNLMTDQTFLEVQKFDEASEAWVVVATDAHWETKFYWDSECHEDVSQREKAIDCVNDQRSYATVEWVIPAVQEVGTYRLVHYGNAKYPDGVVKDYSGMSRSFSVLPSNGVKVAEKKNAVKRFQPKSESAKSDSLNDFFNAFISI